MFKINKLETVKNEEIFINHMKITKGTFNKEQKEECFKTLFFSITGNINKFNYTFSFLLNCQLEELLKIKKQEKIDFSSYLYVPETLLIVNGIAKTEPKIEITICRYFKNKYEIEIYFFTEKYSGIIEFDFNLDTYLSK